MSEEKEVASTLKGKDPEHIGSILEQLFRKPEWKDKLQACLSLFRWQEIVGDKIARQSQPESLNKGVLQVRVANSSWLHHLRFLENDLRRKLNRELPSLEIKELRFRQGPLDQSKAVESSSSPEDLPELQNRYENYAHLDPKQLKLLQSVPDPELRKNLESLLRKQLARSRT